MSGWYGSFSSITEKWVPMQGVKQLECSRALTTGKHSSSQTNSKQEQEQLLVILKIEDIKLSEYLSKVNQ